MAAISSLGIGSGLDLNGLLSQLKSAEQAKLTPISNQIQAQQTTISSFGTLKNAISAFQDATQALNDTASFNPLTNEVEGDGVTAVANSEANAGSYEVKVDQLARAGSLVTERFAAPDESTISGEQTLSFNLAEGTVADITIADGSSLEDIRDAINEQGGDQFSASIINDGEGYRLSVMAKETGADGSIESSNFSSILDGSVATSDAQVLQAGQDAAFNVNGIDIVSSSNQVEDAIQGVTLNLKEAGTTTTVLLEQDDAALREKVDTFVEKFNALKDTIDTLTKFDQETGKAAGLNADATTRAVERELRAVSSSVVDGDGFRTLADIGIELNKEGRLEVDEDNEEKLSNIISTDPGALATFFAGDSEETGLAGQIDITLERLVGDGGRLDMAKADAESREASLKERYSKTEDRIEQTVARYRTQFQAMDNMVAQMNQTSSYLTQQLSMLGQQNGQS